ncbi:hypothetical protein QAD02_007554 [Eretmocerus hayati]|uniref:Uncharacterized protein n=1 Tax=Eretmocerus hayati TaxID=131215 RepID=A0ACC2N6F2_9HYME|nr:hypothetical protein QAD02_007554 [Eretmocerus hayati]
MGGRERRPEYNPAWEHHGILSKFVSRDPSSNEKALCTICERSSAAWKDPLLCHTKEDETHIQRRKLLECSDCGVPVSEVTVNEESRLQSSGCDENINCTSSDIRMADRNNSMANESDGMIGGNNCTDNTLACSSGGNNDQEETGIESNIRLPVLSNPA